jgi:hypothetical protein
MQDKNKRRWGQGTGSIEIRSADIRSRKEETLDIIRKEGKRAWRRD